LKTFNYTQTALRHPSLQKDAEKEALHVPNVGLPSTTHPTLPRISSLGGISEARPGNMQDYIKKLQASAGNFLYFVEQTVRA